MQCELHSIVEAKSLVYSKRLAELTVQHHFYDHVKDNIDARVDIFNKVTESPIMFNTGEGEKESLASPYELWMYYIPLMKYIWNLAKTDDRYLVAVVGAAGSGKSHKTATLSAVGQRMYGDCVDWSPFDGFHFFNKYLESNYIQVGMETLHNHDILSRMRTENGFYIDDDGKRIPLRSIKGMAPSFDAISLKEKYSRFRTTKETIEFPVYSREDHDPTETKEIGPDVRILFAEGNFLFLEEGRYLGLPNLFDLRIFLQSDWQDNKKRLSKRHKDGGKDDAQIEHNWRWVDGPNQDIINATAKLDSICIQLEPNAAIADIILK